MNNPALTWFIDTNAIQNEAYIGSYESTDVFDFTTTVTNNYLGIDPCKDIKNGRLMIMFKDYEDNALLEHMQVRFDSAYNVPLEIVANRAYARIPRVISGDYSSPQDCTLEIKISMNQNLAVKSDLKQLILDIVY